MTNQGKEPGPELSYLTVGGRLGIHVHSSQIVRFLDASAAVNTGQIHNLLSRTWKDKKNKINDLSS